MPSPEVFYLHLDGEQRGPYTVPQIDHLLNSGLIAEETLYWREGLEQWTPVTTLVAKRVPRRPLRAIRVVLILCAAVALLAAFFGPVLLDGWREANQHTYSARAAYWRAREVVRSRCLPRGTLVKFTPFAAAQVELRAAGAAAVVLRGDVIESGGAVRPMAWSIELQFDDTLAEWSPIHASEVLHP